MNRASSTRAQVFSCHRCGQPRPIPSGGWIAPCPSCQDRTPPPPELQQAIDASRAAEINFPLLEMEARTADVARGPSFRDLVGHVARWAVPTVLGTVPSVALWCWLGFWPGSGAKHVELFVYEWLLLLSPIASIVLGTIVWRLGKADAAALRVAAEGSPVEVVTLSCRVCGGPIESRTLDDAFFTCPHCGAQNVVDRDAAAARAKREVAAYASRVGAAPTWNASSFERIGYFAPMLFTFVVLALAFVRCWDGTF